MQATSQLVNALKSEAESQSDSEQQKKLLAAAKLLADATARMVEAAKVLMMEALFAIVWLTFACLRCFDTVGWSAGRMLWIIVDGESG